MNQENKELLQDVIDQLLYNPDFRSDLLIFMKKYNKISRLTNSKLYRTYENPKQIKSSQSNRS